MKESSAGLAAIGFDASHIHTEPFGRIPGLTPGIASARRGRLTPPAEIPQAADGRVPRRATSIPWSGD